MAEGLEGAAGLVERAREAAGRAYAPYSGVLVGAAILARSGGVYAGCNVENAAYPLGHCAESAAIAQGVQAEGAAFAIAAIAVWARAADGAPLALSPCGGCRQRIREHAIDESVPVSFPRAGGGIATFTIGQLLPEPFLRRSLRREPPA